MDSRIPVDLFNPGQVFACLGLMELAEVLSGPCEGVFEEGDDVDAAVFRFSVDGAPDPLPIVLEFLHDASVSALAPQGSSLAAKEAGVATAAEAGPFFPDKCPATPSALPVLLTHRDRSFVIDHWADGSSRDNVKFWAGAGGYSGAALTRDAIELIRGFTEEQWQAALVRPFDADAPMSSSFRFDWRRDYVPLDLGFSLNVHANIEAMGFPLVELLAAIGMSHARPSRIDRRDKLNYRYGTWLAPLPTTLARPVLGGESLGFPMRKFRMRLDWPGQENQARCIVDVQEE